jgi:hypothetical protein
VHIARESLRMAVSEMITPPPSRSGGLTPDSPDSAVCFDHAQEAAEKLQTLGDGRWIKLPEALFSSIMSAEPEINPLHETSKALSDKWLQK